MQIYNIPISKSFQEITSHGTKEFPIGIYRNQLSKNVLGYIPLHWHDELQFVIVLKGCIVFTVNQTKHYIEENNGIFINSGCLHNAIPNGSEECIYISVNVSPKFFASSDSIIQKKYIKPYIGLKSVSYIELNESISWQNEILNLINDLYKIFFKKDFGFELKVCLKVIEIWYIVILNTKKYLSEIDTAVISLENERMKKLLSFIYQNYKEKISLKDISDAGNISRSECSRFFKRMTQLTPFEYLIRYRINQSIDLLNGTDLLITEIAGEVGFGSVSYYIEKFRKQTNYTPMKFRNSNFK